MSTTEQQPTGQQIVRVTEEYQRAGVYYVRTETMVKGFGVSLQMEFGEDKAGDQYILVLDGNLPVSTCRLHYLSETVGKIERVVTLPEYQGRHYGAACIRAAEEWMQENGVQEIYINSRVAAVGFYERLGYTADWSTQEGGGAFVCVMTHKDLNGAPVAE